MRDISANCFSQSRFGKLFLPNVRRHVFAETSGLRCYLAKGAKRPSHTTNTIKFDRIPFDPCNSIKKFDLCRFDQKNSTYLQPPLPKPPVEKCIRCLLIRDTSQFYTLRPRWRWFPRYMKSLDSGDYSL